MNIYDIMLNLAIGVIGGVISSALLYAFSLLYKAGYKKDFCFALHNAWISVSQIETACHFLYDYAAVMGQIDTLCGAAFKMYRCLSPLALWHKLKEKKLIITLLNDIINTCERAKCITVGYDAIKEREARLKKISKCFYRNESLNILNYSTVKAQLDIIDKIMKKEKIRDILKDTFRFCENPTPPIDWVSAGLVDIKSLKNGAQQHSLGKYCFTEDELTAFLRRKCANMLIKN